MEEIVRAEGWGLGQDEGVRSGEFANHHIINDGLQTESQERLYWYEVHDIVAYNFVYVI